LQRAAHEDPDCALIFARLSHTHAARAIFGLEAPEMAMTRAKAAADRALDIDSSLGEAHAAGAVVRAVYEWDWQAAENQFRHALELSPNVAGIHHRYTYFVWRPRVRLMRRSGRYVRRKP